MTAKADTSEKAANATDGRFEAQDLCLYERLSELSGCAATDLVACTIERIDRAADCYRSAIWCYPAGGGDPVQLTAGTSLDNSPNWSPDGEQLAFVSEDGNGILQVFLIGRHGGERRQLTRLDKSVVALVWSRDGTRLLVTAAVATEPASQSGAAARAEDGGPQIAWRIPYKVDGLGYVLDRQIHLFAVDARTGQTRQLTQGPFDVRAMDWSPDGESIVFARTRTGRCAHRTDIWRMQADGSGQRQLTHDVATAQFPAWSPDGRTIVFSGSANEGDAQVRLWTIDCADGAVRAIGDSSAAVDVVDVVDGGSVKWDEDSAGVVLIAARRGVQEVGHIDLADGAYRTIAGGPRHVSALAVTSGARVAFTAESPGAPNQLFVCRRDGNNGEDNGGNNGSNSGGNNRGNNGENNRGERQRSRLNAWWSERTRMRVALRSFEVPDGDGGTEQVEGWVIGADGERAPGPLLVDLHGGPASYTLLAYPSHPYWNALVSRGWTVLALNAVGSSSYGREFSGRLRGRWGQLDLEQHLAAADALGRAGEVDGRLAVAGKSYGGYAAAWAIAATTRFRAAVVSAPITNLETHYGTSDSGYYADPFDMLGEPFAEREHYRRASPAQYANRVRTPVLIVAGKEDQRCPAAQAEDFFVRVMRATDTPAEMVVYPGADHHFYENGPPSQRVDVMTRMVDWLERWIREPGPFKG